MLRGEKPNGFGVKKRDDGNWDFFRASSRCMERRGTAGFEEDHISGQSGIDEVAM